MKALLHIGTEKTGTTTIQNFLAQNRQYLLEDGYLYPFSPGEINHINLTIFSLENTNIQNIHRILGLTTPEKVSAFQSQFKQDFARELSLSQDKTVILSNEHCSSRLINIEDIQRLKTFLGEYFEDIEIIIYLRRQDKVLAASYSTAVRSGRIQAFGLPNQKSIENRYNYWNLLKKWESIFGTNKIKVKVFEANQMLEKDLLKDFASALNIKLSNKYELISERNKSLDIYALEYIRMVNYYFHLFNRGNINNSERREIVQSVTNYAVKHAENDSLLISPKMAEDFMINFHESNQQVATYFLGHSDGKLFYEDISHSGKKEASRSAMVKQFWKITNFLLKKNIRNKKHLFDFLKLK